MGLELLLDGLRDRRNDIGSWPGWIRRVGTFTS